MNPDDAMSVVNGPAAPHTEGVADPVRRRVLKWMAASTALAGAGCSQPPAEPIMPYVSMPERLTPGQPVFYATTLRRHGMGVGVLVVTESGRPIKIEGNPRHPASAGATDAQTQAAILDLWDPERSRVVLHRGRISAWSDFAQAMALRLEAHKADGGAGLRLLTGPISSPTLLTQIRNWQSQFPLARWHRHHPDADVAGEEAARQVFGSAVDCCYRLEHAALVITLGAELFSGAGGVRNAQGFAAARRTRGPRPRLYAFETAAGFCGALADERRAMAPADMEALLRAMAAKLGLPAAGDFSRVPIPPAALNKLCSQLLRARGAGVIAAGPALSVQAHVWAWRLNEHLGNLGTTVLPLARDSAWPDSGAAESARRLSPESLAALTHAMRAGEVKTLLMLDANPVHESPAALGFAAAMESVECTAHMGLYPDETARACLWHVPMAHELEDWSDAWSLDHVPSIVQPAIAPLYGGYSPHVFMDALTSGARRSAHECVRATWQAAWRGAGPEAFEQRWRTALRRGVIDSGAPAPRILAPLPAPAGMAAPAEDGVAVDGGGNGEDDNGGDNDGDGLAASLIAVFACDPNIDTGNQANNAWLQELPRPYTKLAWDNAALLSPATAAARGLHDGDVVELTATSPDAVLRAPICIVPGHADGVITLPLGYGRQHAGSTGNSVGFDAYALQGLDAAGRPSRIRRVRMRPTGERQGFARSQHAMRQEGREIARTVAVQGMRAQAGPPDGAQAGTDAPRHRPSLYPDHRYEGYAWGMTVDLDACMGCNACAIACQAENNIPVVGREQVARGREMHWIRIDLYHDEAGRRPQFQPMACQHCENAPCEVVCPVGATMHDSEGLNVQVYNRCVGTRFCSNNCPYKARRFNFFKYSSDSLSAKAHQNPDVTVRQRGVMEKCTYCVQRISHARIEAQKAGRPIADGDVVTACEAACPTQAIVFGNVNDPNSRVSKAKASARNYAVLEELNTRPRTTYLARVADPGSTLEDGHG